MGNGIPLWVVADLELLNLNLAQMNIKSTEHQESNNQPLLIASVGGSGYPIHIRNNEEDTLCGIDLNTKGISYVKNTQLHAIKHDGLCSKCSLLYCH